MRSVAYYGEPGSYSEYAAFTYFWSDVKLMPIKYLPEIFEAVERNVDYGVVPIENSIEGAVTQTYDMLLKHRVRIVGEHIVKISHCLLANEGVRLKDVKKVYSHPQALGQCREYIQKIKADPIPYYDTAGSAKMVSQEKLKDSAAIASERAAKLYHLEILAKGIETNRYNFTRFFVISKKFRKVGKADKTSIVFSVKNTPGSLFSALTCFSVNRINLLLLQSRPIVGRPWEYNFYVDCEGEENQTALKDSIQRLREDTAFVKVLGSYPSAKGRV
ncbi:MAG: prephenate dehydratase [Candidatus Micrarchaeota archaeon]|nr:prephenate dehydratase [Candidatus Micrarchaeota archaeon]